jgi:hypothetical protein
MRNEKINQRAVRTKMQNVAGTPLYEAWLKIRRTISQGKKSLNPTASHECDEAWKTFEGFYRDMRYVGLAEGERFYRKNRRIPWSKKNVVIGKLSGKLNLVTQIRFPVIPGKVFGRLTVIEATNSDTNTCVDVRCSCGTPRKTVSWTALRHGLVQSCGCIANEKSFKHGQTRQADGKPTPLYNAWQKIRFTIYQGKQSKRQRNSHECNPLWETFVGFASDFHDWDLKEGEAISRIDLKKPWTKENCQVRLIKRKATQENQTPYAGISPAINFFQHLMGR